MDRRSPPVDDWHDASAASGRRDLASTVRRATRRRPAVASAPSAADSVTLGMQVAMADATAESGHGRIGAEEVI